MGKFLLGLLTGVFLVILAVVVLFVAALRFREKPPTMADNSVLLLRLEGDIPEKPPLELPAILGDHAPLTVSAIWMTLRKAAVDSHIAAVVLEPVGLSIGWGKLEEIRGDLEQFRKSGKPVYAYLRTPGTREYYLATAADRIYAGASEMVLLKGLRAELMYFKKTLDKLGVTVDVEHAGKYKDFGDMFTRSDMSPETREVMSSVVDDIYGNLVARVAAARKKTPEEVRGIMDRGPFTAKQAQASGLVDALRFEDEMFGDLKNRLRGANIRRVSMDDYMKVPPEDVGLRGKSRLALIVGEGDITRGDAGDDGVSEHGLTAYGFNKLLRQVRDDSSIKAVVVRIDSPGGEEAASDEMWREMSLLSQKKPMVISMSDVAASGGYDMAMTGDPIVAYPQTETGSIGVVFGKPDLHGLYDKLGITKDAIERGKHADIESDYTSLTPEERELLRNGIDESYRDFVTRVANGRHRTFDQIEPLAQGRVWLGDQAKNNGLVDVLGGLDTAIALVKQRARIPAGEEVDLVTYPPRRNIIDLLTHRGSEDQVEATLSRIFGQVPFHAWMKGGMLQVMPYFVSIR